MEFLVDSLKKNPKASYGDIKAKADEKKLKLYPIMFGRAQALLGIVKSAKRGTGKTAQAAKATAAGRTARASAKPGSSTRGRQPDANSKSGRIRELLKTGMTPMDIAKKVKCTPALVYNVKARMGGPSTPAKRGPGRPPKSASSSSSMDGLSGILEMVKNSDRERTQLRAALEKIQSVIEDALS